MSALGKLKNVLMAARAASEAAPVAQSAAETARLARKPAVSGFNPDEAFEAAQRTRAKLLAPADPKFFKTHEPQLNPSALEALRLYVDNDYLFHPERLKRQRAAVENAIQNGRMTPAQAENLDNLRRALLDAADSEFYLPGPIYRGLNSYDLRPSKGDVLGGGGPGSFTYNPEVLFQDFLSHSEPDRNAIVQISAQQPVKGLVVPRAVRGDRSDESEVILHPSNRLTVTSAEDAPYGRVISTRNKVKPDSEYSVGAWKRGGLAQIKECSCGRK